MVAIRELNIKAIQGCLYSPHLTAKLHGSRFVLRLALCRIKRDVPQSKVYRHNGSPCYRPLVLEFPRCLCEPLIAAPGRYVRPRMRPLPGRSPLTAALRQIVGAFREITIRSTSSCVRRPCGRKAWSCAGGTRAERSTRLRAKKQRRAGEHSALQPLMRHGRAWGTKLGHR